mgnify:CR=1 FL=1
MENDIKTEIEEIKKMNPLFREYKIDARQYKEKRIKAKDIIKDQLEKHDRITEKEFLAEMRELYLNPELRYCRVGLTDDNIRKTIRQIANKGFVEITEKYIKDIRPITEYETANSMLLKTRGELIQIITKKKFFKW